MYNAFSSGTILLLLFCQTQRMMHAVVAIHVAICMYEYSLQCMVLSAMSQFNMGCRTTIQPLLGTRVNNGDYLPLLNITTIDTVMVYSWLYTAVYTVWFYELLPPLGA